MATADTKSGQCRLASDRPPLSDSQRRVDLQGRLSNPPYHFGRAVRRLSVVLARGVRIPVAMAALQRQRWLTSAEVDDLVERYAQGDVNVRQLAALFGINRETAMLHLRRRGVPSRATVRRLDDDLVGEAAARYVAGEAMASLCQDLGIAASTLRRELTKAGIPLRRPGRPRLCT